MARPGVTEEEVFEAIETLYELGAKVTVEGVRAELGRGSPNTINRHLRTWREKPAEVVNNQNSIQAKQLKRKCAGLESQALTQAEKLESLSIQLLDRDRKIVELEKAVEKKEQSLKEANAEINKIAALNQTMVAERKQVVDALVQAQREQAEQFREDLKAVNLMSLEQVRETSMSGHDAWLEEKVKVRELSLEVKETKKANMELEKRLVKEQNITRPLRKRLAQQEELIANCLDPIKVEQFKSHKENEV